MGRAQDERCRLTTNQGACAVLVDGDFQDLLGADSASQA
jgi:hypothetical protein